MLDKERQKSWVSLKQEAGRHNAQNVATFKNVKV